MAKNAKKQAAGAEQAFHALRAAETERNDADKRVEAALSAYRAAGTKRLVAAAEAAGYFGASPAQQTALLAAFGVSAGGAASSTNNGQHQSNKARGVQVAADVAHNLGGEKMAVVKGAGLKWHGRAQAWVGWVDEETHDMLREKFGPENLRVRNDKPKAAAVVDTQDGVATKTSATSYVKAETSTGHSDPPGGEPLVESGAGAEGSYEMQNT